jgi:hypothetical protein
MPPAMRHLALAVAVLAVACSNKKQQIIQILDAPIDVAPDAPLTSVTVTTFNPPQFFAYRDGAGAWQTATASGGNYTLHVTNDYVYVVVCAANGSFQAIEQGATVTDGRQFAFCSAPGTGTPSTVAVTGQMVQAGTLWMQDTKMSATANWPFTLNVSTGKHDLIAMDADHMAVRRGLNITAAMAVPNVDVDTEGAAITPATLTVNNLGSDTLSTELDWFLANDYATIKGTTTTVQPPPTSLVTGTDFEFFFLDASTSATSRTANVQWDGTTTTFDLMPTISGITYDPQSEAATWGTLPTYTDLSVALVGASMTTYTEQQFRATKSWLDATHATSISFDSSAPGYDPAWKIDPASTHTRMFTASSFAGRISYDTSAISVVGPAARVRPMDHRAQLARLTSRQ